MNQSINHLSIQRSIDPKMSIATIAIAVDAAIACSPLHHCACPCFDRLHPHFLSFLVSAIESNRMNQRRRQSVRMYVYQRYHIDIVCIATSYY